ncbi:AbrB/MazE/SpoVT family DNA-binding domain-containing protein [Proteiniclasticum sp. BAD-10]|uniref:AbrB/MazE/SpoVT family DNA-binding domain-containing protein n=2 Tax=Proteiniclasticum sediminis TaxID=2804028 RepID=A0A941CPS5_9CLOT|nr:AbrB/MazE/SpoVT family DNA-binding domain-containing protein [Proteiniclasticum sediminis]
MSSAKSNPTKIPFETKRIQISSKRQITIPAKFFNALGFDKEIECIFSGDMLIIKPVKQEDSYFAEQILNDLIRLGYTGDQLLVEFKKMNRKVKPAVEKLIEEADRVAKLASMDSKNLTNNIFNDDDLDE